MPKIFFQKNGSDYITSKVEEAVHNQSRTAIIRGNWEIEKAVRLPSNFTLILENCHLRMADGVFSYIFINQNHDTEIGRTIYGTDRNINIIGHGEAILDGGLYNGLSEKSQLKNGLPPVWKNNLIFFTNVDGFRISNISCRNQRWWALNFIYCSNGHLDTIDFRSNDTCIDANGNEYHGFTREKWTEIQVYNADGIDLRQGCRNILIENINGFTGDDSVALTSLNGALEKNFSVKDLSPDLCNIEIRNIRTASFCTNVRLLNQGGLPLHDIVIDGVYDLGTESPFMDQGIYAVRIGDPHLYGSRHATENETYNITVKNVRGGGSAVIALAGNMKNLVMDGIESINGAKLLQDERIK